MRRVACLIALGLVATACTTVKGSHDSARTQPASRDLAYTLANQIALGASNLDVDAVLPLIPANTSVVYVSNGVPIRGDEYRAEMGAFYGSLRRLTWTWEKWEAAVAGPDTLVFTGWGRVVVEPRDGEAREERAIYTMTFVRQNDGWKRILAHKTKLPAK